MPKLPDLLGGLNPQSQNSSTGDQPKVVCSLLRVCRTPAGSVGTAQQSDVGRLLVGPAVTS